MLSIDFETRSKTDLITDGSYNYFADLSTEIICMAWAFDDMEPRIWVPGDPVPIEIQAHVDRMNPIHAWNATFERLAWDYIMVPDFHFPAMQLSQWRCSAYMSRCNNLPNMLKNAARALACDQQKHDRGRELIKLLCVPLGDGTFCRDPELLEEMNEYCRQDVRTERDIHHRLREPSPEEWQDYFTNEKINDRGIRIDRELAEASQAYAAEEEADLVGQIEVLTEGAIIKARGEKLKAWVVERLTDPQLKILTKYRGGEKKISLDKVNRFRLLADEELDPIVREVVECSDMAQKSSVGKFRAMANLADLDDDRVRGALLCNGAGQTGRFSSRGLQVHNFPRATMDDPDEVRLDLIENIMAEDITDYYELPMMAVLSRMLRGALIPKEDHVFLVSDWSAIEGKIAPWLCNDPVAEKKLDLYREGKDTYVRAARSIYSTKKITAAQRQVGKVAELALQFGGGAGAFIAMARGYGLSIAKEEAEKIKVAWRLDNPWAPEIWKKIESAAKMAMNDPGNRYDIGRLSYFTLSDVLCGGLTLFCQLPCGRLLTYPDARIEPRTTPWGDVVPGITALRAAWTPKVGETEWPRADLWGGLLFENVVQGTAGSMLRYKLREAEESGLNTVLHVHDELVIETLNIRSRIKVEKEDLHKIMNTAPGWAQGLPLAAEVEVMERFGK